MASILGGPTKNLNFGVHLFPECSSANVSLPPVVTLATQQVFVGEVLNLAVGKVDLMGTDDDIACEIYNSDYTLEQVNFGVNDEVFQFLPDQEGTNDLSKLKFFSNENKWVKTYDSASTVTCDLAVKGTRSCTLDYEIHV